ncbi:MAG: hypothetical protein WC765_06230 [Phycisphaerae bacterium]
MTKLSKIGSSFKYLDLSAAFNCGLRDKPQGGTHSPGLPPGWLNLGYDFRNLKPGILKAGKIEFTVVDPAKNHDKSIIVLHGKDFLKEATVTVDQKCDWVYLLHGGGTSNRGDLGTLELVYVDGDKSEVAMACDVHYAGAWYQPAGDAEHALPICITDSQEQDAALYAVAIRNLHPDKILRQLVFHSNRNNTACWMVFAAATGTGSDLLELDRLKDMKDLTVSVDVNRTLKKIRRLHGTNLAAPLMKKFKDINQDLKELDIPIVRFHDVPLGNPGMKLVDISMVFPIFSADPRNPENYYFDQTDDYVASCLATGTKISYRLGESIEQFTTKKHYAVHPPEDYDKWAEICCNIIAHYNEGWANGFHYNIEYWPIWEEPHTANLWTGTWSDYNRLYVTTAKKIKERFPKVKVGGPTAYAVGEPIREFLKECKKQNAPLDFFAWNHYGSHPDTLIKEPYAVRKMLDEYGFNQTETQVAEWNYFPGDFGKFFDPQYRIGLTAKMSSAEGAAYICSVLSGWQDTPLDMGNYYIGTFMEGFPSFGLFDPATQSRHKTYYAMKAFNIMTKYENRVYAAKESDDNSVRVLSGRKATGETAVLISCFKTANLRIIINFGDYKFDPDQCKVSVIDPNHDLTPMEHVKTTGNTITLEKPTGSTVFLVEIAK